MILSFIIAQVVSVLMSYCIFKYIPLPYEYIAENLEFFSDTISIGSLLLIHAIIYPIILKYIPDYDYETMNTLDFIQYALIIILLAACMFGAVYYIDTLAQEDYEN